MGILFKSSVFGAIALLLLSSLSFAETTCSKNGCDITLTIKMAFSGADDAYMNKAKNEIESFWNGPNGYRLVGDCKCKMTVKVETMKITNASQVNCNPGPPGYHCIMVTDFATNPPRNQTNITGAKTYRGYLYGITAGSGNNSQMGWWSNQMSAPIAGTNYYDMAHEAGHLMGLGHSNNTNSIMNNTANTQPSQDDLDGAAKATCGDNYCPDSCCCGNGQIDKNKGENCDPKATPTGCTAGASCCPVCCQCYKPLCIAANGEYLTLSDCQLSCWSGSSCYKNYKTGCWDCLRQSVVVTGTCRDSTNIRGNNACDHLVRPFTDQSLDLYRNGITNTPVIGGIFANERMNFKSAEGDTGYIITRDGFIEDYGTELLADPTVTVSSSRETLGLIAGEQMTVQQALASGNITIQGNDFFSGLKFGFYNLAFGLYNFFSPAEGAAPPAAEPDLPDEHYQEMDAINEAGPQSGTPPAIGDTPDGGYYGDERVRPELD